MNNDFIIKNNRKYFRTFCFICGKDKGYKSKDSAKRPCYSCNGKKANQTSIKARNKDKDKCLHVGCDSLEKFKGMCQKHYDKQRKPNKNKRTHCTICNKKMEAKTANKKYCSKACNSASWKARNPLYRKNKLKKDINARIAANLRTRVKNALKNNYKSGSAVEDLGCSIEEFKVYLESKFTDGMNWGNYSQWHIDHIKPLCLFDLTDPIQFRQACHYSNLQPMWALDNLKKSSKYDE